MIKTEGKHEMSETKLLPCPFCGNADGRNPEQFGVRVWQERRFRGLSTKGTWIAECLNCGPAFVECPTEAIAAWNTRTPDPRIEAAQGLHNTMVGLSGGFAMLMSALDEGQTFTAASLARSMSATVDAALAAWEKLQ